MGLTINYELSVSEQLKVAVVRELVQRVANYAEKIGCVEVGQVRRAAGDHKNAGLFVQAGRPEDCCFGIVPPKHGWLVEVWPGEGCESATFGLCQYPRRTPYRSGWVPTGFDGGWLLKSRCKTQYAGEQGWQHFLKCHKQIISLLDFWRDLGMQVEVSDEGGYWETRSEQTLRQRLEQYDGLIASVAGMFKDASGAPDGPFRVESPIFDYANFERLEHEGRQRFGGPVEELRKQCREGLF
jgi:hypothetical protein